MVSGMRRTTMVFSVVKSGDEEYHNNVKVCDSVVGMEKSSEKKIVKVYERKRKRFNWDVNSDGLVGNENSRGAGRNFGNQNQFMRRKKMRKIDIDTDSLVCQPCLVIMCTSHTGTGWLSRFLNSVLAYLMNHEVKLSKVIGFLCSIPICSVFESQGIHFLQKFSDCCGSGYCKIYGVTQYAPLFSVNFSAIPACFMNIYSSKLLQSEKLVFTYLVNIISKTYDEILEDDNEIIFSIALGSPNAGISGRRNVVNNIRKRNSVHGGIQSGRDGCHRMRLRSSFGSSNIRGRRSGPRSRRGRPISIFAGIERTKSCVSYLGLQKTNDVGKMFGSPIADVSCNSLSEGHSIGVLQELKDQSLEFRWGGSNLHSSRASNKRARRAGSSDCEQNNGETKLCTTFEGEVTDFESCAANILVIDHDKCYRVQGASIVLELSPSNRWLIVVKKDGFKKYSHMAEMVMRPCTFNRATHNIIWTISNDCKLEFPTREDWSIFKELYKVCSLKNLDAPNDYFIPVPGVRIISNYEDTITAPYSRPDAYISFDESEVSRVLAKASASYDIDSEDEEWLATCNEEILLQNESHKNVSLDTLEQIIDTIEKALYLSPGDQLDERSIADVCAKLGNEDFIGLVYSYWSKKRKQKCPTLVRILQAYKPGQVLDASGPIIRKKRSFKRHSCQNGGGKQMCFSEGEQLTLMEVEEANAIATRYSDLATHLRKRAQALMENADMATYKAAIAVKIAQAAKDSSLPVTAAFSMILI